MDAGMRRFAWWLVPALLIGCQVVGGKRHVAAHITGPVAHQVSDEVVPAAVTQSAWTFSDAGGDCPAAFEFAMAGEGSVIASDYCGTFDELYVGLSGRVVELKSVDPGPAPGLREGWQRSFRSEAGDIAVLRIDRLARKEFEPESTDEGCTRLHFDAVLRVRPVAATERVVHGSLSGGCP